MRFYPLVISAVYLCAIPMLFAGESGNGIWDSDFLRGWSFLKSGANPNADTSNWEKVDLPHTWNALDGQTRKYYRGPGVYCKTFRLDEDTQGKRVFIRFRGVASKAQIYLNGELLGEHKGAFGPFCYELSDLLDYDGENELRVLADNSHDNTIPPLSGDFNIFGGIYRPVELLIENPVCISPLRRGSHGVSARQRNVSDAAADLEIGTLVDNGTEREQRVALRSSLIDADGRSVAEAESESVCRPNAARELKTKLHLADPHLWNGIKDPYLYGVKLQLICDGEVVDSYEFEQGFRFFDIDPEKGFFLNGKRYPLWGVNRHQDWEDMGWALTPKQHERDMELIAEMGARSIRLAHYPQSEYFFQLCDRNGLLVTAELPLVNKVDKSAAFAENSRLQMEEMIDLYGNYTSVFAYGLFNEIYHRRSDNADSVLNEMNALCHRRDDTRYTYGATNQGGRHPELNHCTDLLAFNGYPGWYGGSSAGMSSTIGRYQKLGGSRGIGISEYGAGASIKQHETHPDKPVPKGRWHPEEYQTLHHEKQFEIIRNDPRVWGSYVWNMFDFASNSRNEGDRGGINDKGLVTHDREVCKDAFYFYKANLSTNPVLYIASRRHKRRSELENPVKLYSNVGPAELFVNGKSAGVKEPNDMHIARWEEVCLEEGVNRIVVKSTDAGTQFEDECVWTADIPDALGGQR